jgi:hypothetical protein
MVQSMSRVEALMSNAYAAFEEEMKGVLQPGKLADITVLLRDIMIDAKQQYFRSARFERALVTFRLSQVLPGLAALPEFVVAEGSGAVFLLLGLQGVEEVPSAYDLDMPLGGAHSPLENWGRVGW